LNFRRAGDNIDALIWGRLIVADTAALFSVLFWEGLASAGMIFALWKFSTYIENTSLVKQAIILRLACSLGYLLIIYRGVAPDFWSSTVGNLLLFYGFYRECRMILTLIKSEQKKIGALYNGIWISFSIAYLAFDLINGESHFRIALASLTMFALFLPLTLKCLFTKNAPSINRVLAIPYLLVVTATIPRFIHAFTTAAFTIHSTNIYQTFLCIALLLKSFFGTLFFFLLMKIDSDKEIEKLAQTDGLTGLVNRRSYFEAGNRMLDQCRQTQQMMGVFFMDIDSFKSVNDEYGHVKGDEALIAFGQAIMQNTRGQDVCCRYGGDEFSICVYMPNPDNGYMIAERILDGIRKIDVLPGRPLTTSIGLVYGIPGEHDTFEYFVRQADEAMYTAKQSGKNRINFVKL